MPAKENLEIERKFILKGVPAFPNEENLTKLMIHQIYVTVDGRNKRFRKTYNVSTGESIYHECMKKKLSHGVFEENEKLIEESMLNEMEALPHRAISKTRYVYQENGLKWEIDDYENIALVTLEVELDDINQEIKIPNCIEDWIITEVTGLDGFSNYNMSSEVDGVVNIEA